MLVPARLLMSFLAIASASIASAEWRIELEPAASTVEFSLKATLHTVHGTAQIEPSVLHFDPQRGEIEGEIVVAAPTADTGNAKRDKKMHAKVLRSHEFPEIALRPVQIDEGVGLSGTSRVTLTADIGLLGSWHRTDIPLSVRIEDGRFEAVAEFEIPYVEWGLEDPSTFVLRVAKEVQVAVDVKGTIAEQTASDQD